MKNGHKDNGDWIRMTNPEFTNMTPSLQRFWMGYHKVSYSELERRV